MIKLHLLKRLGVGVGVGVTLLVVIVIKKYIN